jgi:MoxR-like ATPase
MLTKSPNEAKILMEKILFKTKPQTATIYMSGAPGCSKSSICKQIADKYNMEFIDLRLSQLQASDLRGIPFPNEKNKTVEWFLPVFIPREGCKDTLILFDEVNRMADDVMQAAFQILYDRKIGDIKIPDNVYFIAAGNLGIITVPPVV